MTVFSPEPSPQNQVRFEGLVDARRRCRELAEHHLSALNSFRSTGFPGRTLGSLPSESVSIPTFRRLHSSERVLDFRMSSTCAAVRSILRHPGANYQNLRPLHLVTTLLQVSERAAAPTAPAPFDLLQLAQLADLTDLLIQTTHAAQAAVRRVDSIESWIGVEDLHLTDAQAAVDRARSECVNQVWRDLKDYADVEARRMGTVNERTLDSLRYSLMRLRCVALVSDSTHTYELPITLSQNWSRSTTSQRNSPHSLPKRSPSFGRF